MSTKFRFRHRAEWDRYGLAPYRVLTGWPVHRRNVGVDDAGAEYGEWFYVPDEPTCGRRVLYFGYFGTHLQNEDAPWIFAEVFDASHPDELAEFTVRVREWEARPEFDPQR